MALISKEAAPKSYDSARQKDPNYPAKRPANYGYLTRLADTLQRLNDALEAGDHLRAAENCRKNYYQEMERLSFLSCVLATEPSRRVALRQMAKEQKRVSAVLKEEMPSDIPEEKRTSKAWDAWYEIRQEMKIFLDAAKKLKAAIKWTPRPCEEDCGEPLEKEVEEEVYEGENPLAEFFSDTIWSERSAITKPVKASKKKAEDLVFYGPENKKVEVISAPKPKKMKSPENWARMKANFALARQARKMQRDHTRRVERLNGVFRDQDALRSRFEKVYGKHVDIALKSIGTLPTHVAHATLKNRTYVNKYVQLRLGKETTKHAEWSNLTFEEIEKRPEILLSNWRYYTRHWTSEQRLRWQHIKSVDQYKDELNKKRTTKVDGRYKFLASLLEPSEVELVLKDNASKTFEEMLQDKRVQAATFAAAIQSWPEGKRIMYSDVKTWDEYRLKAAAVRLSQRENFWTGVFKERTEAIRQAYPECLSPREVHATVRAEGYWRTSPRTQDAHIVQAPVRTTVGEIAYFKKGRVPTRPRLEGEFKEPIVNVKTTTAKAPAPLNPIETPCWPRQPIISAPNVALEVEPRQVADLERVDLAQKPQRAKIRTPILQTTTTIASIWDPVPAMPTALPTTPISVVLEGKLNTGVLATTLDTFQDRLNFKIFNRVKEVPDTQNTIVVTLHPKANLEMHAVPLSATWKRVKQLEEEKIPFLLSRGPDDMHVLRSLKRLILKKSCSSAEITCPCGMVYTSSHKEVGCPRFTCLNYKKAPAGVQRTIVKTEPGEVKHVTFKPIPLSTEIESSARVTYIESDLNLRDMKVSVLHSVGADLHLGAGFALEAQRRLPVNWRDEFKSEIKVGSCLKVKTSGSAYDYLLITKKKSFVPFSYIPDIRQALASFAKYHVKQVHCPRFECNLNGNKWEEVSKLLNVAKGTEFIVYGDQEKTQMRWIEKKEKNYISLTNGKHTIKPRHVIPGLDMEDYGLLDIDFGRISPLEFAKAVKMGKFDHLIPETDATTLKKGDSGRLLKKTRTANQELVTWTPEGYCYVIGCNIEGKITNGLVPHAHRHTREFWCDDETGEISDECEPKTRCLACNTPSRCIGETLGDFFQIPNLCENVRCVWSNKNKTVVRIQDTNSKFYQWRDKNNYKIVSRNHEIVPAHAISSDIREYDIHGYGLDPRTFVVHVLNGDLESVCAPVDASTLRKGDSGLLIKKQTTSKPWLVKWANDYCFVIGKDKDGRIRNGLIENDHLNVVEFWSDTDNSLVETLAKNTKALAELAIDKVSSAVGVSNEPTQETKDGVKKKTPKVVKPKMKLGSQRGVDKATDALRRARETVQAAKEAERLARSALQSVSDVHDLREGRPVGTTFRSRSRSRNPELRKGELAPRSYSKNRSSSRGRSTTRGANFQGPSFRYRSRSRSVSRSRYVNKPQVVKPKKVVKQISKNRRQEKSWLKYLLIFWMFTMFLLTTAARLTTHKPATTSTTSKPEIDYNVTLNAILNQEKTILNATDLTLLIKRKGREVKTQLQFLQNKMKDFLAENNEVYQSQVPSALWSKTLTLANEWKNRLISTGNSYRDLQDKYGKHLLNMKINYSELLAKLNKNTDSIKKLTDTLSEINSMLATESAIDFDDYSILQLENEADKINTMIQVLLNDQEKHIPIKQKREVDQTDVCSITTSLRGPSGLQCCHSDNSSFAKYYSAKECALNSSVAIVGSSSLGCQVAYTNRFVDRTGKTILIRKGLPTTGSCTMTCYANEVAVEMLMVQSPKVNCVSAFVNKLFKPATTTDYKGSNRYFIILKSHSILYTENLKFTFPNLIDFGRFCCHSNKLAITENEVSIRTGYCGCKLRHVEAKKIEFKKVDKINVIVISSIWMLGAILAAKSNLEVPYVITTIISGILLNQGVLAGCSANTYDLSLRTTSGEEHLNYLNLFENTCFKVGSVTYRVLAIETEYAYQYVSSVPDNFDIACQPSGWVCGDEKNYCEDLFAECKKTCQSLDGIFKEFCKEREGFWLDGCGANSVITAGQATCLTSDLKLMVHIYERTMEPLSSSVVFETDSNGILSNKTVVVGMDSIESELSITSLVLQETSPPYTILRQEDSMVCSMTRVDTSQMCSVSDQNSNKFPNIGCIQLSSVLHRENKSITTEFLNNQGDNLIKNAIECVGTLKKEDSSISLTMSQPIARATIVSKTFETDIVTLCDSVEVSKTLVISGSSSFWRSSKITIKGSVPKQCLLLLDPRPCFSIDSQRRVVSNSFSEDFEVVCGESNIKSVKIKTTSSDVTVNTGTLSISYEYKIEQTLTRATTALNRATKDWFNFSSYKFNFDFATILKKFGSNVLKYVIGAFSLFISVRMMLVGNLIGAGIAIGFGCAAWGTIGVFALPIQSASTAVVTTSITAAALSVIYQDPGLIVEITSIVLHLLSLSLVGFILSKCRITPGIFCFAYWQLNSFVRRHLDLIRRISIFKNQIEAREFVDSLILTSSNTYFVYQLWNEPSIATVLLWSVWSLFLVSHNVVNYLVKISHVQYFTYYQTKDVSLISAIPAKIIPLTDSQKTNLGRVLLETSNIPSRYTQIPLATKLYIITEADKVFMHDFAEAIYAGGMNIPLGNAGFISHINGKLYGCSHIFRNCICDFCNSFVVTGDNFTRKLPMKIVQEATGDKKCGYMDAADIFSGVFIMGENNYCVYNLGPEDTSAEYAGQIEALVAELRAVAREVAARPSAYNSHDLNGTLTRPEYELAHRTYDRAVLDAVSDMCEKDNSVINISQEGYFFSVMNKNGGVLVVTTMRVKALGNWTRMEVEDFYVYSRNTHEAANWLRLVFSDWKVGRDGFVHKVGLDFDTVGSYEAISACNWNKHDASELYKRPEEFFEQILSITNKNVKTYGNTLWSKVGNSLISAAHTNQLTWIPRGYVSGDVITIGDRIQYEATAGQTYNARLCDDRISFTCSEVIGNYALGELHRDGKTISPFGLSGLVLTNAIGQNLMITTGSSISNLTYLVVDNEVGEYVEDLNIYMAYRAHVKNQRVTGVHEFQIGNSPAIILRKGDEKTIITKANVIKKGQLQDFTQCIRTTDSLQFVSNSPKSTVYQSMCTSFESKVNETYHYTFIKDKSYTVNIVITKQSGVLNVATEFVPADHIYNGIWRDQYGNFFYGNAGHKFPIGLRYCSDEGDITPEELTVYQLSKPLNYRYGELKHMPKQVSEETVFTGTWVQTETLLPNAVSSIEIETNAKIEIDSLIHRIRITESTKEELYYTCLDLDLTSPISTRTLYNIPQYTKLNNVWVAGCDLANFEAYRDTTIYVSTEFYYLVDRSKVIEFSQLEYYRDLLEEFTNKDVIEELVANEAARPNARDALISIPCEAKNPSVHNIVIGKTATIYNHVLDGLSKEKFSCLIDPFDLSGSSLFDLISTTNNQARANATCEFFVQAKDFQIFDSYIFTYQLSCSKVRTEDNTVLQVHPYITSVNVARRPASVTSEPLSENSEQLPLGTSDDKNEKLLREYSNLGFEHLGELLGGYKTIREYCRLRNLHEISEDTISIQENSLSPYTLETYLDIVISGFSSTLIGAERNDITPIVETFIDRDGINPKVVVYFIPPQLQLARIEIRGYHMYMSYTKENLEHLIIGLIKSNVSHFAFNLNPGMKLETLGEVFTKIHISGTLLTRTMKILALCQLPENMKVDYKDHSELTLKKELFNQNGVLKYKTVGFESLIVSDIKWTLSASFWSTRKPGGVYTRDGLGSQMCNEDKMVDSTKILDLHKPDCFKNSNFWGARLVYTMGEGRAYGMGTDLVTCYHVTRGNKVYYSYNEEQDVKTIRWKDPKFNKQTDTCVYGSLDIKPPEKGNVYAVYDIVDSKRMLVLCEEVDVNVDDDDVLNKHNLFTPVKLDYANRIIHRISTPPLYGYSGSPIVGMNNEIVGLFGTSALMENSDGQVRLTIKTLPSLDIKSSMVFFEVAARELIEREFEPGTWRKLLIAPTGTGKTTRFPIAILKEMIKKEFLNKEILLVEPLRGAARNAYNTLKTAILENNLETNTTLCLSVGEKTGESSTESFGSGTIVLNIMTYGKAKEYYFSTASRPLPDIVLLDECHMRQDHTVCLLTTLLSIDNSMSTEPITNAKTGKPVVCLVTATDCGFTECTKLAEDRRISTTHHHIATPALIAAESDPTGKYKNHDPSVHMLVPFKKCHSSNTHYFWKDILVPKADFYDRRCLIFVDTIYRVKKLANLIKKYNPEIQVFTFYAGADPDYLNCTTTSVIVTTDVLGVSVTVENVSCVVDSCVENKPQVTCIFSDQADKRFTYSMNVAPQLISENTSMQRKGRTGRNCAGVYYQLSPSLNKDSDYPASVIPGIAMELKILGKNSEILDYLLDEKLKESLSRCTAILDGTHVDRWKEELVRYLKNVDGDKTWLYLTPAITEDWYTIQVSAESKWEWARHKPTTVANVQWADTVKKMFERNGAYVTNRKEYEAILKNRDVDCHSIKEPVILEPNENQMEFAISKKANAEVLAMYKELLKNKSRRGEDDSSISSGSDIQMNWGWYLTVTGVCSLVTAAAVAGVSTQIYGSRYISELKYCNKFDISSNCSSAEDFDFEEIKKKLWFKNFIDDCKSYINVWIEKLRSMLSFKSSKNNAELVQQSSNILTSIYIWCIKNVGFLMNPATYGACGISTIFGATFDDICMALGNKTATIFYCGIIGFLSLYGGIWPGIIGTVCSIVSYIVRQACSTPSFNDLTKQKDRGTLGSNLFWGGILSSLAGAWVFKDLAPLAGTSGALALVGTNTTFMMTVAPTRKSSGPLSSGVIIAKSIYVLFKRLAIDNVPLRWPDIIANVGNLLIHYSIANSTMPIWTLLSAIAIGAGFGVMSYSLRSGGDWLALLTGTNLKSSAVYDTIRLETVNAIDKYFEFALGAMAVLADPSSIILVAIDLIKKSLLNTNFRMNTIEIKESLLTYGGVNFGLGILVIFGDIIKQLYQQREENQSAGFLPYVIAALVGLPSTIAGLFMGYKKIIREPSSETVRSLIQLIYPDKLSEDTLCKWKNSGWNGDFEFPGITPQVRQTFLWLIWPLARTLDYDNCRFILDAIAEEGSKTANEFWNLMSLGKCDAVLEFQQSSKLYELVRQYQGTTWDSLLKDVKEEYTAALISDISIKLNRFKTPEDEEIDEDDPLYKKVFKWIKNKINLILFYIKKLFFKGLDASLSLIDTMGKRVGKAIVSGAVDSALQLLRLKEETDIDWNFDTVDYSETIEDFEIGQKLIGFYHKSPSKFKRSARDWLICMSESVSESNGSLFKDKEVLTQIADNPPQSEYYLRTFRVNVPFIFLKQNARCWSMFLKTFICLDATNDNTLEHRGFDMKAKFYWDKERLTCWGAVSSLQALCGVCQSDDENLSGWIAYPSSLEVLIEKAFQQLEKEGWEVHSSLPTLIKDIDASELKTLVVDMKILDILKGWSKNPNFLKRGINYLILAGKTLPNLLKLYSHKKDFSEILTKKIANRRFIRRYYEFFQSWEGESLSNRINYWNELEIKKHTFSLVDFSLKYELPAGNWLRINSIPNSKEKVSWTGNDIIKFQILDTEGMHWSQFIEIDALLLGRRFPNSSKHWHNQENPLNDVLDSWRVSIVKIESGLPYVCTKMGDCECIIFVHRTGNIVSYSGTNCKKHVFEKVKTKSRTKYLNVITLLEKIKPDLINGSERLSKHTFIEKDYIEAELPEYDPSYDTDHLKKAARAESNEVLQVSQTANQCFDICSSFYRCPLKIRKPKATIKPMTSKQTKEKSSLGNKVRIYDIRQSAWDCLPWYTKCPDTCGISTIIAVYESMMHKLNMLRKTKESEAELLQLSRETLEETWGDDYEVEVHENISFRSAPWLYNFNGYNLRPRGKIIYFTTETQNVYTGEDVPLNELDYQVKRLNTLYNKLPKAMSEKAAYVGRVFPPKRAVSIDEEYNIYASRGAFKFQQLDEFDNSLLDVMRFWDVTAGFGGAGQYYSFKHKDNKHATYYYSTLQAPGHRQPIPSQISVENSQVQLVNVGSKTTGDIRDPELYQRYRDLSRAAPPQTILFDFGEVYKNIEEEGKFFLKEYKGISTLRAIKDLINLLEIGGTCIFKMLGVNSHTPQMLNYLFEHFGKFLAFKMPTASEASREWYLIAKKYNPNKPHPYNIEMWNKFLLPIKEEIALSLTRAYQLLQNARYLRTFGLVRKDWFKPRTTSSYVLVEGLPGFPKKISVNINYAKTNGVITEENFSSTYDPRYETRIEKVKFRISKERKDFNILPYYREWNAMCGIGTYKTRIKYDNPRHLANGLIGDACSDIFGWTPATGTYGWSQTTRESMEECYRTRLDHDPGNPEADYVGLLLETLDCMTTESGKIRFKKFGLWPKEKIIHSINNKGATGKFADTGNLKQYIDKNPHWYELAMERVNQWYKGESTDSYWTIRAKKEATKRKDMRDDGTLEYTVQSPETKYREKICLEILGYPHYQRYKHHPKVVYYKDLLVQDERDLLSKHHDILPYFPSSKKATGVVKESFKRIGKRILVSDNTTISDLSKTEVMLRVLPTDELLRATLNEYGSSELLDKMFAMKAKLKTLPNVRLIHKWTELTDLLENIIRDQNAPSNIYEKMLAGSDKVPRVIQFADECTRLAHMIVLGHLVEEHAKDKLYKGSITGTSPHLVGRVARSVWDLYNLKEDQRTFGPGYNRHGDVEIIGSVTNTNQRPMCLMLDFSKFDKTQTVFDRMMEGKFYKQFYPDNYGPIIDNMLSEMAYPICFDDYGNVFTRSGQRSSGELTTSVGNTLLANVHTRAAIAYNMGISPYEFNRTVGTIKFAANANLDRKTFEFSNINVIFDGDDGFVTGPENIIRKLVKCLDEPYAKGRKYVRSGTSSGVSLCTKFENLEFCSHSYSPVVIGPNANYYNKLSDREKMIQCKGDLDSKLYFLQTRSDAFVIGKMPPTLKLITKRIFNNDGTVNEEAMEITRGKVISYLLLYPHSRVIRCFCLTLLSLIGDGNWKIGEPGRISLYDEIENSTLKGALKSLYKVDNFDHISLRSYDSEIRELRILNHNAKLAGKTCPTTMRGIFERCFNWLRNISVKHNQNVYLNFDELWSKFQEYNLQN